MTREPQRSDVTGLPEAAQAFIRQVTRKMGYRKKARAEVRAELVAHFEDELRACQDAESRERKARELVEEFGDAGLLAVLCRRAKKRCRPLWRKAVVRGLQAAGIIVLYIVLCSARLSVGTPSIKVDYLPWLSDRVQAGRDPALNAKPLIDQAVKALAYDESLKDALSDSLHWPGDMNEPQRRVVAGLVVGWSEAFEKLRLSMERPYYWVRYEQAFQESLAEEYDSAERERLAAEPPDTAWALACGVNVFLPDYRTAAQAFSRSVLWKAYQGDISGALDDATVLVDFGAHLEGQGTLMEQLVGIAIEALANRVVFMILDRCDVAAADLADCQRKLERLYDRQASILDVTGEKAVFYAFIQKGFTDDGDGNGRVLREGVPLVVQDWRDGVTQFLLFDYPDRREVMRRIDAFYGETQLLLQQEPWRAGREGATEGLARVADESVLLRILAGSYERLGNLLWRQETGRRGLIATLAIVRYQKDKGACPDDLDRLVAEGYLSETPIDPYSGRLLRYRKTADGFGLYSWGENLTDDAGRMGTGKDGQPRMWANNGDWVFWPIPKTEQ